MIKYWGTALRNRRGDGDHTVFLATFPALSLRLVTHRSEHPATTQQSRSAEQFEYKELLVVAEQGTGGETLQAYYCTSKLTYYYNIRILEWWLHYFSGSLCAASACKPDLWPDIKCVTVGTSQLPTRLSQEKTTKHILPSVLKSQVYF